MYPDEEQQQRRRSDSEQGLALMSRRHECRKRERHIRGQGQPSVEQPLLAGVYPAGGCAALPELTERLVRRHDLEDELAIFPGDSGAHDGGEASLMDHGGEGAQGLRVAGADVPGGDAG